MSNCRSRQTDGCLTISLGRTGTFRGKVDSYWRRIAYFSGRKNNFQIIGREGQNLARNIKESIYIRVNNPSLNNNIGKFNPIPFLG